jgi:hypothetical protein
MQHAWLGVKDVHKRFGGLIGRETIITLMKLQHIPSKWVGRALATTERAIEEFEERLIEADEPIEFKDQAGNVILVVAPTSTKKAL